MKSKLYFNSLFLDKSDKIKANVGICYFANVLIFIRQHKNTKEITSTNKIHLIEAKIHVIERKLLIFNRKTNSISKPYIDEAVFLRLIPIIQHCNHPIHSKLSHQCI